MAKKKAAAPDMTRVKLPWELPSYTRVPVTPVSARDIPAVKDATATDRPVARRRQAQDDYNQDLEIMREKGEIRQGYMKDPILDQLGASILAEAYTGATENLGDAWDRYMIDPETVQDASQFYNEELPGKFPGSVPLAALGSTLTDEAYPFYRAMQTDPLNLLLGMPKAGLKAGLGAVYKTMKPAQFTEKLIDLQKGYYKGILPAADQAYLYRANKAGANIAPIEDASYGYSFRFDDAMQNAKRNGFTNLQAKKRWDELMQPGSPDHERRYDLMRRVSDHDQHRGLHMEHLDDLHNTLNNFNGQVFPIHGRIKPSNFAPGADLIDPRLDDLKQMQLAYDRAVDTEQMTRHKWGPGVYYYPTSGKLVNPTTTPLSHMPPETQFFTRNITDADLKQYMIQQDMLDMQPQKIKDAIAKKDIIDISATEDYPMWRSMQQLQAMMPMREFRKKIVGDLGIKGSLQMDYPLVNIPGQGKYLEAVDFDIPSADPWRPLK
jgi:hypothetical protein